MKQVYFFGNGQADGQASMKDILGGKGANLAEMTLLGLPVPPGFTIATATCFSYLEDGGPSPLLVEDVRHALARIEACMGATFGDGTNPLLVSVRSGARASMPGMMDTVLNLGLNASTVEALATKTNNPRFAYDSYRRFIQMYANVVKNMDHHHMDIAFENYKNTHGKDDSTLDAHDLLKIINIFKSLYFKEMGESFPENVHEQLWNAIGAVFRSWNCQRAKKYREIHNIPDTWGTAVNVCAMVYGNMGSTSGTGVCFTRNPSTGDGEFYGEYLVNAQGEDVVAGLRTPHPIGGLQREMPGVFDQLRQSCHLLEKHYRDMQDIEFTIQEGRLYFLQTRSAKRTTQAALKVAIALAQDGLISKREALLRIKPADLEKLLHPTFAPNAQKQIIARGLPASPGAVTGRVVFRAADAEVWSARGEKVILVRDETSPEDIGGMYVAQGFLTIRGGMTSHAAVVARQMGKCCVVGCSSIALSAKTMRVGQIDIFEGDWISLDGSTGDVILGKVQTQDAQLSEEFSIYMGWIKELKKLRVRANADTPRDALLARRFGAEGIGLCRTEHMFFEETRLPLVRKMILAKHAAERKQALEALLPIQRQDFVEIFSAMHGLPVTVRLLDPPLHEFLPHTDHDIRVLSTHIGLSVDEIKDRVKSLQEANPMLGHRGCRLGISHPEIYEMQVQAIVQAEALCRKSGLEIFPEIMIPLVGLESELKWLKHRLLQIAPHLSFGTMIEVPRAALTADAIAQQADFFSFGTNDLTQTTFGFSRDDSAPFLEVYKNQGILHEDPFAKIDRDGVGRLMQMAVQLGRKTNPGVKLGLCGEHGGDPESVHFCHTIGLDYVSCSPYRIPVAALAAAHAESATQTH